MKRIDYRLYRGMVSDMLHTWKDAPEKEYSAMDWIAGEIYARFFITHLNNKELDALDKIKAILSTTTDNHSEALNEIKAVIGGDG